MVESKWQSGGRRIITRVIVSLAVIVGFAEGGSQLLPRGVQIRCAVHVLEGNVKEMCEVCWESYHAGYMTRTEVWQCVYYLDLIRRTRDERRRIPKRDPDDPQYLLYWDEGLIPFILTDLQDRKDWYFLKYLPTRRRRLYRLKAAGREQSAPEERVRRVGLRTKPMGGRLYLIMINKGE